MSTYTPIATQTLGSAASSVTFSSLPQNYTDLIIVVNGGTSSGANALYMRFNGDSSSLYSTTYLYGNGSSAASGRLTDRDAAAIGYYVEPGTGNQFNSIVQIQNYSNSATFKTVLDRANSTAGTYPGAEASVSLWRNTAPINQIEIRVSSNTLNAGTTFTIYGVAAGNSSAKATGGNIVTTDGSYWYHTFTSSGTFIPSEALTVDYLVVAGGGSGGTRGTSSGSGNGGGGAGGLRSTVTATGGGGSLESALSLSANTVYQAIVGAGGAGIPTGVSTYTRGNSGTNSIFATITSIGGGAGGAGDSSSGGILAPLTGGSGGGAGYFGSGAAGTANQGYSGGSGGNGNPPYYSGGGGGAGGAGGNANGAVSAGAAGAGLAVAISGSSVTYAAGGAGGDWNTGNTANAAANSGSASSGSGLGSSGNGGSGIIIIRYAV